MKRSYILPAAILAGVLGGFALGLAGCGQESGMPSTPLTDSDAHPATMASQARLWLGIENAENVYIGDSTDPWLTDSWYTEAQTFDIVVTNTSDFSIDDVYLLVTIPAEFVGVPGWSVQVGDQLLTAADFTHAATDSFGFDGGSHGVYPPSGTGVFYPYPMAGILGPQLTWTVPVITTSGTAEGFRLHFDAGSTRLWTPPSHDVTVLPPVGGGEELPMGACCLDFGGCVITDENGCQGIGSFQGPGSLCEPPTCGGE
jgi:hypothetical protein